MWIRGPLEEHKGIEETKGPSICLNVVRVSQSYSLESHPRHTKGFLSHHQAASEVFSDHPTELCSE